MLNELAQYAKKQKLIARPGYKPKHAKWVIVLSDAGEFIDVEPERDFPCCPSLDQGEMIAGGITRSHFLLDSLAVVTGTVKNEKNAEKNAQKHNYFISLLHDAANAEPMLELCANALEDSEIISQIQNKLTALKAKPNDNLTFRVGNVYPLELDTWHNWWDEFRGSIKSSKDNTETMVCLLSGEITKPVLTHEKISGLNSVGGQSTGTVLVGFDKDSFQSFGLKQSLNAACSEQSVALYSSALNNLIALSPRPLAGAKFIHWFKEPLAKEFDPIELALGLDQENEATRLEALNQAEKLLRSVENGERPELLSNIYYVLELSAAGGRIMVRDWFVGNYAELANNIRLWFDDIRLVTPDGKGMAKPFKLWAGLARLLPHRNNEQDLSKRINTELSSIMPRIWRSIIQGSIFPDTVPARALRHIQSRLYNVEEDNLDRISCAWLKAWYNRKNRNLGGGLILHEDLLTEHPSPAYQSGRLMAVLAEIQRAALGDVGAGIVQRYFAAASSTPALVLGRLVKISQFHLDKLDRGLAIWYEKIIAEIASHMGSQVPNNLNLEEQTLFALGYYQQKAVMFTKKNQPE
ncbi:MAG: type I-C CRISPR-associated protein Cas8c/Csd1 [Peptococcaceae bacterium]|jgi:CRISPR-associated protein Csd1|nr:type I-C CRISPR-associated protein Cas8c/Csd1 [Peptococcaceae bacterium]